MRRRLWIGLTTLGAAALLADAGASNELPLVQENFELPPPDIIPLPEDNLTSWEPDLVIPVSPPVEQETAWEPALETPAEPEAVLPEIVVVKKEEAPAPPPPMVMPSHEMPSFFIDGEFLYWKADISGLISAYSKSFPITPDGFPAEDELVGKVHQINYKWAPAFRFSGGYRFQRDLWELKGIYTYYHTTDSNTATIPDGAFSSLAGTLGYFTDGTLIVRIPSKADFRYQIGDLLLDRLFSLSDKIKLTFFTGGRGAYIAQKWKVRNIANNGSFSTHKMQWAFKGGGVNIGMGSQWLLGSGFAFTSGGSLSTLYGDYDNTYRATTTRSTPGIVNDANFGDSRVVFGVQFSSGFSWTYDFEDVSESFSLYAAYELNSWFNLNELYQLADIDATAHDPSSAKPTIMKTSPVSLQGLVVGATLRF